MNYVVGLESTSIPQVYLTQTGTPILTSEFLSCWVRFEPWTVVYRSVVRKGKWLWTQISRVFRGIRFLHVFSLLVSIGSLKTHGCKGLFGTCHGHVKESARRIRIFVSIEFVPPSVQNHNVFKLQSFGAMCRKQQETMLATSGFASPFSKPLNKVIQRYFPTA